VTACSLPPDWDEEEELERIRQFGEKMDAVKRRLDAQLKEGKQ